MNLPPPPSSLSKTKLAVTLLVGLVAGGAGVFAIQTVGLSLGGEEQAAGHAPVIAPEPADDPIEAVTVETSSAADPSREIALSDREREVLKRLASLPDLPLVKTPAFDIQVQTAVPAKVANSPSGGAPQTPAAKPQPAGESVIARIQVVSVEKGRVFYRSVDDNIHTARAGDRLLGVNGRVLKIDEHGAELQIDGHRMRVAANNM